MEVKYNVTGKKRKELAQAIEQITGKKASYQGPPTFSYEIGDYMVTRDGTLQIPDDGNYEDAKQIIDSLAGAGFNEDGDSEDVGLTISIPLDKVNVGNLTKLLDSKGDLIKKALGIDDLPIKISEDEISFPWFTKMPDAEECTAYTHFIAELCRMSKEQTRITATAKEVENEKYAFRCFLLRLGFIGDDYKTDRKILLKNLSGSSAFKGGARA